MICYMPFTEIAKNPFDIVAQSMGPITAYGPSNTLLSEQMRVWQRQGLLDLRTPTGLDDGQFLETLKAFKDWAQLHDGHISDMIQFFNANQGRPPLMDETAPSQISTQIRHHGQDDTDRGADPTLQAALFLALAQEYDQHQDRLCRDMDRVADMENVMYATMGADGNGSDRLEGLEAGIDKGPRGQDSGAHMTGRRLQAWAQIAFQDAQPSWAYVTSSAAVFKHLKGLWSEVVELAVWHLSAQADDEDLKQQRHTAIQNISSTKDVDTLSLAPDLCGLCTDDTVPLTLVGIRGSLFEAILPKRINERLQRHGQAPASQDWPNTVIGLVGCQNDIDGKKAALPT